MATLIPLFRNKTVLLFDEIMLKLYYLQILRQFPSAIQFLKEKDGIEITIVENDVSSQYIVFLDYGRCSDICSPAKCLFERCTLRVCWREKEGIYKYHCEQSSTIDFLNKINKLIDKSMKANSISVDYYDYFLDQMLIKIGF
jgi:hypothetical protein